MQDFIEVTGDPDKPNIRYAVLDIDQSDLYRPFQHIITDLEMNNVNAAKVLVFCRRRESVRELYEMFADSLRPHSYYRSLGTKPMENRTRLFPMYHKKHTVWLNLPSRRNFVRRMEQSV